MTSNRGFTLIEVMIVVVIIGILTALAVPRFNMTAHSSKVKEADLILKQVYTTQRAYMAQHGVYAATQADLSTVGFDPPAGMQWYSWSGNVAIPLCLAATNTSWPNRRIDGDGVIDNC